MRAQVPSDCTVHQAWTGLRSALANAVRDEIVIRNVAALVRVPLPRPPRTRQWSVKEGQRFLEGCRRIFAEIEALETGFADARGAPKGRLRVSLPLIGMLMMPTLSQFTAAYPAIELDLDFTDHLVDVITDGSVRIFVFEADC